MGYSTEMGKTNDNILELKNLTKHYAGFSLESVNLELPYGCIMGLIGENGAGKSTTIKAILGLLKPDAGQVVLFGEENGSGEDGERISAETKEKIGVVLGELNLPATFTGYEICRMMQGIYKNWDAEQFYQYLDQYGIDRKKKIKDYSRGMKMKAALAIALSHDAKLLLLDEPTSGLDPVAREEVLDLLRDFVMDEERSVLISSHIISDLEKTADYVAFLHQGKLILSEEKDQLLAEYKLLKGSWREIEKERENGTVELFGVKETSFNTTALVKLHGFRPERSGLLVESAALEDIMIYLIQGERRTGR